MATNKLTFVHRGLDISRKIARLMHERRIYFREMDRRVAVPEQFSTQHRVYTESSEAMKQVADGTVQLVVTSPPYPMIELWDGCFNSMEPSTAALIKIDDPKAAFELMHLVLDRVWAECLRILEPGGILCINVGDATRKLGGHFRLYSNHARVLSCLHGLGFEILPGVLWRKPTNAPNKFMGSGMLPGGAYVTLEHEHILIVRKPGQRAFDSDEVRARRRASAYFWEERNTWFSDLWEIAGERQTIDRGFDLPVRFRGVGAGAEVDGMATAAKSQTPGGGAPASNAAGSSVAPLATRTRSSAFPLEVPLRLIAMYSLYGDTVVDPFWGTGTTTRAAIALGRSSAGYEVDEGIASRGLLKTGASVRELAQVQAARLNRHVSFISSRNARGKVLKHRNSWSDLPVITAQEQDLVLYVPQSISETDDGFDAVHCELLLSEEVRRAAQPWPPATAVRV